MFKNIKKEDVIIIENISLSEKELNICEIIAKKTMNTWQKRGFQEILSDTIIGKVAESGFKNYLSIGSFQDHNPYLAFYDDFRIDNFNDHNSIDFIFSKSLDNLVYAQYLIQSEFKTIITSEQRSRFKKGEINIGEIKSTRISDKYIKNGIVDIDKILNMDFLTYPNFIRKHSTISNFKDYCNEVNKINKIDIQEIKNIEKMNMLDYYIRIFVLEKGNNLFDIYLVGALNGCDFFDDNNDVEIKKMVQNGKSENAIYISKKINQGETIESFKNKIKQLKFKTNISQF